MIKGIFTVVLVTLRTFDFMEWEFWSLIFGLLSKFRNLKNVCGAHYNGRIS